MHLTVTESMFAKNRPRKEKDKVDLRPGGNQDEATQNFRNSPGGIQPAGGRGPAGDHSARASQARASQGGESGLDEDAREGHQGAGRGKGQSQRRKVSRRGPGAEENLAA